MAAALPELLASARQQVTMQEDVRRLSQQVEELTRLVRTLHGVPNNTDVDGLRPAPEGTGAYGDADNGMLASAPVLYHQAGALGASQVSALGPQVATKAPSHRASHSAVKGETAKRVQSAMKFAVKHQTQEIFGSTYSSGLQQQATSNNKSEYERAQQRKYRLIIYPISTFRLSWDMVAAMLICFVAVVLPYRVAFVDSWSRTWAVVDFLVDVFFICDFALNFCTAYIGPTGILERRHHKIALHYLRTWFALDLLATVPLEWFVRGGDLFEMPTGDDDGSAAQLFSLLRLFKLLKLLRLLRVAKMLQQLNQLENYIVAALSLHSHSLFSICKLLIMLLTFAHWNGCIQFYLSNGFDKVAVVNGTLTTYAQHPDSWILRADIRDLSAFERWTWSYYHAMVQLLAISEGLVPPRRLPEAWSFIISILLGAALYAVFVASLTSVVGELGAASRRYRSRIDRLGEYMRDSAMPSELRTRLLAYYDICYPKRIVCDEAAIVEEVSHPLRFRIALHHCNDVLESLQVLHNEKLSRSLAMSFVREVFVGGDVIIHEGEEGRGMYFLREGFVDVIMPTNIKGGREQRMMKRRSTKELHLPSAWCIDEDEAATVVTLPERAFFGEMALLSPKSLATASVRVRGRAETFHLSVQRYAKLLQLYPDFRSYVEMVAKLRISSHLLANEGRRQSATREQITRLAEQRSLKTLMSSYSVMSDWDRGEREPGASPDASPEAGRLHA